MTQQLSTQTIKKFQKTIYDYFKKCGRDLPWRRSPTPYHVVVSEIMLQQTQVDRVIPKYKQFLKQFSSFQALAKAPLHEILAAWSGLGYNRRAIALKKIAEKVVGEFHGKLPNSPEVLTTFTGIGRATAASIAVYAFNQPIPFIETNVRAVYLYYFFKDKKAVTDERLWPYVVKTMDTKNPREWFNALMDYGVMLKKQFKNPSRKSAHHTKQSKFEGSNRQLRGKIIRIILQEKKITVAKLTKMAGERKEAIENNIQQLEKEGFLKKNKNTILLT